MSLTWNDKVVDKLIAQFGRRVEAAGIHLKNAVKENVSTPSRTVSFVTTKSGKKRKVLGPRGSNRSQPDEYFHKDSGFTRAHIASDYDPEKLKSRVGSPYKVLRYLELGTSKMAPRKGLRATLDEEKQNILEIIRTGNTVQPSAAAE
jgi:hypothetical protein